MIFIKETELGYDLADYLNYIESVKYLLPQKAHDFATMSGRYNLSDRKSLHDSWVTSFIIDEHGNGERQESRNISITITLFGAHHDGLHRILYKEVGCYCINVQRTSRGETSIGHGDWIVDEILVNDDGSISHEIQFSDSGSVKITCKDIEYNWIDL